MSEHAVIDQPEPVAARPRLACAHCGAPCPDDRVAHEGLHFCCTGCRTVFQILQQSGLGQFYALEKQPGVRVTAAPPPDRFAYLDAGDLREKLADFADARATRITLRVPSIHCLACVWLLENLFRLEPAIGPSRVNFPRRELTITFDHHRLPFSKLAHLLASLGYEPALNLGALREQESRGTPANRGLWLRIGVAGFAFGNIMLLSIPSYLGLKEGEWFRPFFGWLSLGLAVPVLLYSASDYWRASMLGLRRRMLTIEFPIAIGLAALFLQSAFDVATGAGEGYFDSFAGLVFFLLCGRWFQQKSFDWLSFERDYRSYFPLSVQRVEGGAVHNVPLTDLRVGDRIRVRHGELVPADARLLAGAAHLDYSFVTGESEPVPRAEGDYIYAGGRQVGSAIELETVKETSRSYMASLWDHEAFRKPRDFSLNNMTNRAGRAFTVGVLLFALAATGWWVFNAPADAPRIFASILIVACPCALALSAPFALGAAVRLLARHRVFLKNTDTVEALARADAIVLDKTGTLTHAHPVAHYVGTPLAPADERAVRALASHSTHPLSRAIAGAGTDTAAPAVTRFAEVQGRGIRGTIDGRVIVIGSAAWLAENGCTRTADLPSGAAGIGIDGGCRGWFTAAPAIRTDVSKLAAELGRDRRIALLSGDSDGERDRYANWLGPNADLRFNQTPSDKLEAVRALQQEGHRVAMIGDGLNDAGALRQSDAGIAVTEQASSFSPASDVILEADQVARLPELFKFAREAIRVVYASFVISICYNLTGLSFAATGHLSPLVSAILMPISSFTVISFALLATRYAAARSGWGAPREDAA
ncbi:MAG TPA: heavy metal translocating P-type ATPase metal-binding domain-containing protein [Kiritimatiellia bacterium]|nr:heavy metal translocating P-type ATPase metal-binding domain-containing protein [Kiritimatiellia bacterium]